MNALTQYRIQKAQDRKTWLAGRIALEKTLADLGVPSRIIETTNRDRLESWIKIIQERA